jgi:hypothetical protein
MDAGSSAPDSGRRPETCRPPFQLRLPTVFFSVWCIFAAFTSTVGFRGVFLAWLFTFIYYRMNSITAKKVEQLEVQFQLQKAKKTF